MLGICVGNNEIEPVFTETWQVYNAQNGSQWKSRHDYKNGNSVKTVRRKFQTEMCLHPNPATDTVRRNQKHVTQPKDHAESCVAFFFFFFLNETLRRVFPNRFPDVRGRRLSPDLNPRDCFYYDISQTKCSPLTVAQSVIWKRLHKNKWFQSLRKFVSRITEFRFRNWHVISHRRGYTEHLHHEFWMSFLRNLLI